MSPSDDPFDARPTSELLATDALLDRVGARAPTPDDLDDPLVAALALMAAEIDLDTPPVGDTRDALVRAAPDLPVPPSPSASGAFPHDESTGLVIDLRDSAMGRRLERQPGRARRRPPQPERAGPPVAMAPPRSLPRMPAPGGPGSRPPQRREERRMRPMVAVAVALTAIVIGSGASAAVTGGRSVNPLDGIEQVVAVLTHGRTADQQKAYQDVKRHLDAAEKDARNNERASAQDELEKVGTSLLNRLNDDDRADARKRINEVRKLLAP